MNRYKLNIVKNSLKFVYFIVGKISNLIYIAILPHFSYADWYSPREDWSQSLFAHDTVQTNVVNTENPQPNGDVGSLCTAMALVNPHISNNWVKIPCDYPMFDAGLICKRKAIGAVSTFQSINDQFP